MRNIFLLVKVQLNGILRVSRFFASRQKAEQAKMLFMLFGILAAFASIVAVSWSVVGLAAPIMGRLGLIKILPILAFTTASISCLCTNFFTGAPSLLNARDEMLILPMPVSTRTLIAARMITLYLIDLVLSVTIVLPLLIQVARYTQVSLFSYTVACVLGILSLPVLPMVFGSLLGTVILFFSSRFRHKNIISIILLALVTIGAMALSISMSLGAQNIEISMIFRLVQVVTDACIRMYPPCYLFAAGLSGSVGSSVLLLLLSLAAFMLVTEMIARMYLPLRGRMSSVASKKGGARVKDWPVSSPFMALLYRELKHYIALPIYLFNTMSGLVLMLLLAGSVLIFGDKAILLLQTGDFAGVDMRSGLSNFGAIVLFVMASMSCTSCSSISLEGVQFAQLKALPVSERQILLVKGAFNALLIIPCTLLSSLLLLLALDMKGLQALLLFVLPLTSALLVPAWGLIANLLFPRFDWTNETQIVKQSMASFIGLLGVPVITILVVMLFVKLQLDFVLIGVFTLLMVLILGIAAWAFILTQGVKRFRQL